jgi:hypothetical protein
MQTLNDLVAERVMGWLLRTATDMWYDADGHPVMYRDHWCPEIRLLDAWQVVEWVTSTDNFKVLQPGTGHPIVTPFSKAFNQAELWACTEDEAAREICFMALRATTGMTDDQILELLE